MGNDGLEPTKLYYGKADIGMKGVMEVSHPVMMKTTGKKMKVDIEHIEDKAVVYKIGKRVVSMDLCMDHISEEEVDLLFKASGWVRDRIKWEQVLNEL